MQLKQQTCKKCMVATAVFGAVTVRVAAIFAQDAIAMRTAMAVVVTVITILVGTTEAMRVGTTDTVGTMGIVAHGLAFISTSA